MMHPSDPKLPALSRAVDDTWMAQFLGHQAGLLEALNLTPPISVNHQMLKYANGKRCVIAYHLRNGHEEAVTVVGKLYREDRGAAIFDYMQQLWEAEPSCKIARPYQYFPELGLSLQELVPGKPLASYATPDSLLPAVETAARNLAQLHTTPVSGLRTRKHMAEHLDKYCRPHPAQLAIELARVFPAVSAKIETILSALLDTAVLENIPLCTVHNDLSLAHVYWHQGTTTFIDFDGLCRSHAALDLANFRVALKVYFGSEGEKLGEYFLDVYQEERETAVQGLTIYEAFIYLRRATICYRKKAEAGWLEKTISLLEQSLEAVQANQPLSLPLI